MSTIFTTVERDGHDIEVEVEVEYQPPEPDVGIGGGVCVHGATRVDDGSEIQLTDKEQERISEDHVESFED